MCNDIWETKFPSLSNNRSNLKCLLLCSNLENSKIWSTSAWSEMDIALWLQDLRLVINEFNSIRMKSVRNYFIKAADLLSVACLEDEQSRVASKKQ